MADIKNLKVDLKNKILSCDKVIILPHKDPDFDALGSAAGLSFLANKLRKDFCSSIVVDIPRHDGAKMMLEDMKGNGYGYNIISVDEYLDNYYEITRDDLVILTDVNAYSRIPISIDGVKKENIIVIDHHEKSKDFVQSKIRFIDCKSSSASEIVTKLLCQFNIKYKSDLANYLLAGIYLDTDRLKRIVDGDDKSYPDTLDIVSKLKKKHKASPSEINKYFMKDFAVDRKVHRFIDGAQFTDTYGIIVGRDEEFFQKEELAMAADYLLPFTKGAAFTVGRVSEEFVSVSARAKENSSINISKVMQKLGGGGSKKSAAAMISDATTEEVGKRLVKVLHPSFVEN